MMMRQVRTSLMGWLMRPSCTVETVIETRKVFVSESPNPK